MKRLLLGSVAIGVYVLSVSISAQAPAQGGGRGGGQQQQPAPTNLQVLPKDMTAAQVIPIMQGIAAGLGVACNYCHVTAAGGAPANDFPNDMKPTKKTARTMLLMVRDINSKLGSELGKPAAEVTQVGCVTCHRGVPIPKRARISTVRFHPASVMR